MNMKKILLATCALAMVGGIDANAGGRPRYKVAPRFLTNLGITKDQLKQDAQTVGKQSSDLKSLVTSSTQRLAALQQSAGKTVTEMESTCQEQSAIIGRQMVAIDTLKKQIETEKTAHATELTEAEDSAKGLAKMIEDVYSAKDKAALDAVIPDSPNLTEIEMMMRILWAQGHPTAGVDVTQLTAKLGAPLTNIAAPKDLTPLQKQLEAAKAQLQTLPGDGSQNTNNP